MHPSIGSEIRRSVRLDDNHRLWLGRSWGAEGEGFPMIWVMLNPSLADAERDDKTVRKCISFAKARGASGLAIVNLFTFISPDPPTLNAAFRDGEALVHPGANGYIDSALQLAHEHRQPVIAAWGAFRPNRLFGTIKDHRIGYVVERAREMGVTFERLQVPGRSGSEPGHPGRLAYSTPFIPWEPT